VALKTNFGNKQTSARRFSAIPVLFNEYRPLSTDAETKDFARLTSYPVRGWTGKNKAFCSPGTQNGRCVIKVYCTQKLTLIQNLYSCT